MLWDTKKFQYSTVHKGKGGGRTIHFQLVHYLDPFRVIFLNSCSVGYTRSMPLECPEKLQTLGICMDFSEMGCPDCRNLHSFGVEMTEVMQEWKMDGKIDRQTMICEPSTLMERCQQHPGNSAGYFIDLNSGGGFVVCS